MHEDIAVVVLQPPLCAGTKEDVSHSVRSGKKKEEKCGAEERPGKHVDICLT
jgi:hypothetical protein